MKLPRQPRQNLKVWKEVHKVKCISPRHDFTKDKIYEVFGICLIIFEDRSNMINYIIKNDKDVLSTEPLCDFLVIEEEKT